MTILPCQAGFWGIFRGSLLPLVELAVNDTTPPEVKTRAKEVLQGIGMAPCMDGPCWASTKLVLQLAFRGHVFGVCLQMYFCAP